MPSILDRCDPALEIAVGQGSILLSEGQRTGRIYVLAKGTMEVLRGNTRVALVNDRGAMFGEMSVLLDTAHTATVRAVSPAAVFVFEDGAAFLRSDPEMAFILARLLAQRLSAATGYLADLKRQYAGADNHLGMVSDVLASLTNQPRIEFTPGSDRQPDPAT